MHLGVKINYLYVRKSGYKNETFLLLSVNFCPLKKSGYKQGIFPGEFKYKSIFLKVNFH